MQTTIAYIVIRTEQFLVMFSLLTLVLAKNAFTCFIVLCHEERINLFVWSANFNDKIFNSNKYISVSLYAPFGASQEAFWRSSPLAPGRIFTKCNRIRKTSSFYRCDCHKTLGLSFNCHRHSSLRECWGSIWRMFSVRLPLLLLSFWQLWLHVLIRGTVSLFFQTLGSGVRFRG